MASNIPDERLVYLSLKNVFRGTDAKLRVSKKIRQFIENHLEEHREDRQIRALIDEHNIESVCNVARTLLHDEIFESTQKAKIRFPEVFDVSPVQSAEREVSAVEAARCDAFAIRDATEGRRGSWASIRSDELEGALKDKGKHPGMGFPDSP